MAKEIDEIKKAAGDYQKWALAARKQYINLRLRQDKEIANLYIRSADRIAKELKQIGTTTVSGQIRKKHFKELEKSLRAEAERIQKGLTEAFVDYINSAAKAGAGYTQGVVLNLFDQAGLKTSGIRKLFSRVNKQAVEAVWARTRNGLYLSDRIWEQSENYRTIMRDLIQESVAIGQDAVKTARMLQQYVRQGAGSLARDYPNMMKRMKGRIPGNISYEALRLARTEMTAAFGEGTIAAARVGPSYIGMKWVLSHSHPVVDICDTLAAHDEGLGRGVYSPGNEPPYPAHPSCMCALVSQHEEPEKFVERLKKWRDDPSSDQELEKWYNEIYKSPRNEAAKTQPTIFTAAKTKKEAQEFAKEVLGIDADYSKFHVPIANAVNSELLKAKQVFGSIEELKHIGTFAPGYPTSWKGMYVPKYKAIWLRNVSHKDSLAKLKQQAEQQYQIGFWSTASELHAIRHELGHAIDWSLKATLSEFEYNHRVGQINKLRSKIQEEVLKTKKGSQEYAKYLSRYAFTNTKEFIAESIAEYLDGNPRKTAKTVVSILLGIGGT